MKKIILIAIVSMLTFSNAYATIKCTNGPGGLCCWDPATEGPWRPVNCD